MKEVIIMYCGKCGIPVKDGWTFCVNCGNRQGSAFKAQPKSDSAPKAPIDRAAQIINRHSADNSQLNNTPEPVEQSGRAATAVYNPQAEKTRVYLKPDEPRAEHIQPQPIIENNSAYDDGFTDYYSEDIIRDRIKQPVAAYIVSIVGLLDFVLIVLAYNNIKLNISDYEFSMKDYGLWFLGAGAALMLTAFILYSVCRSRHGLNFAGATGMIVSIGAFVVILLLLCLGLYTWLSTTQFLDLPKLPTDLDAVSHWSS